jgi:hypothetical protein
MHIKRSISIENLIEMRGQEIAHHEGQIKIISDNEYEVLSQSKKYFWYMVRKMDSGWICNCPDFRTYGG